MKLPFVGTLVFVSLLNCLPTESEAQETAQKPSPRQSTVESQLAELRDSIELLNTTVRLQQEKINHLSNAGPVSAATPSPQKIQEMRPNVGSAGSSVGRSSGSSVPDIGVVVDIVGTATKNKSDEEGNDRLSAREVELIFGHDIDPYARMDVVATFSDQEDPDIEEANITYWGLPYGIKARVGRMRERIGKASATHRDALETVDEPLVIQRYLGAEGLFRTGLELAAFTPLSLTDYTQELVLGVMEGGGGEDSTLFGETRRHPTGYAHLANFLDISEVSSFELGGTYLVGSQGDKAVSINSNEIESEDSRSAGDVHAFGLDATFAHFFSPINKLKLQSEFYFQQRSAALGFTQDAAMQSNPYGFYALADYRLAERWGIGARFDFVEPTTLLADSRHSEKAYSAYLTFFESEFGRWRLQYQRALQLDGKDDDRLFVQGTFAIGAHKHNLN